jgi:hypothetical protein
MTCTLTPLLFSLYFANSQKIGVVRIVPLLPSEGGTQGLHHDVLVVVHLRLLVAAHLGDEPRQLAVRGRINMQHKEMMRSCQHLMLAMYMLVHGEDLEKTTPIALRHALTQGEIKCSGPRHSK